MIAPAAVAVGFVISHVSQEMQNPVKYCIYPHIETDRPGSSIIICKFAGNS